MIVKRLVGTTALALPLVLAAAGAGAQQQQGQPTQGGQSTPLEEQTDMPATQHQEETLRPAGGEEQRRTAPQDGNMPSSEHQREVIENGEQQGQKSSQ
jgi:hypothetical protein